MGWTLLVVPGVTHQPKAASPVRGRQRHQAPTAQALMGRDGPAAGACAEAPGALANAEEVGEGVPVTLCGFTLCCAGLCVLVLSFT